MSKQVNNSSAHPKLVQDLHNLAAQNTGSKPTQASRREVGVAVSQGAQPGYSKTQEASAKLAAAIQNHKAGDTNDALLASAAGDFKRLFGGGQYQDRLNSAARQVVEEHPEVMEGHPGAASLDALKADIANMNQTTITSTRESLAAGDGLGIKNALAKGDTAGIDLMLQEAANNFVNDNKSAGRTVSRSDFANAVGGNFGENPTGKDLENKTLVGQRLDTLFPANQSFNPQDTVFLGKPND